MPRSLINDQALGSGQLKSALSSKNNFHTQGGQTFFHTMGGDKHLTHKGGRTFLHDWGGINIFIGSGGGGDKYDVDGEEEEDVSEANILASKASKLSAGVRILRGS